MAFDTIINYFYQTTLNLYIGCKNRLCPCYDMLFSLLYCLHFMTLMIFYIGQMYYQINFYLPYLLLQGLKPIVGGGLCCPKSPLLSY